MSTHLPQQQIQAKDLERFQREKRKVIKALKLVKGDFASLEGTKYVTRGFEGYQTIEFNRIVRKQRRAVVESVMSVQREHKKKKQQLQQVQEENGGGQADHYYGVMEQDDLEEAVAHAARQESAWARELAHQMGLKDEETVRLGWQEFFAEVAVDGELSNSDSETSLSSLSVQDCPTSSIFDHMHFEHVTCVVENCTTYVA
jgi:HD-GYP domain-containing protein (c-di-GMP phosphodiesterase class II)